MVHYAHFWYTMRINGNNAVLTPGNRQRRIDTDLVQDNTENQILKELETISGVKATLTECLRNARDQLTASREAKHNLEMDWSDKV